MTSTTYAPSRGSVGGGRRLGDEVQGCLKTSSQQTCRELGELLPPESRNDNDRVCYEMDVEYRQYVGDFSQSRQPLSCHSFLNSMRYAAEEIDYAVNIAKPSWCPKRP